MAGQETSWERSLKGGGRPVLSTIATAVAAGALVVAGLIGPRIGPGDAAQSVRPERPSLIDARLLERRLLTEARALQAISAASALPFTEADFLERRLLAEARALQVIRAASRVPFSEAEFLECRLLAEARALGR